MHTHRQQTWLARILVPSAIRSKHRARNPTVWRVKGIRTAPNPDHERIRRPSSRCQNPKSMQLKPSSHWTTDLVTGSRCEFILRDWWATGGRPQHRRNFWLVCLIMKSHVRRNIVSLTVSPCYRMRCNASYVKNRKRLGPHLSVQAHQSQRTEPEPDRQSVDYVQDQAQQDAVNTNWVCSTLPLTCMQWENQGASHHDRFLHRAKTQQKLLRENSHINWRKPVAEADSAICLGRLGRKMGKGGEVGGPKEGGERWERPETVV